MKLINRLLINLLVMDFLLLKLPFEIIEIIVDKSVGSVPFKHWPKANVYIYGESQAMLRKDYKTAMCILETISNPEIEKKIRKVIKKKLDTCNIPDIEYVGQGEMRCSFAGYRSDGEPVFLSDVYRSKYDVTKIKRYKFKYYTYVYCSSIGYEIFFEIKDNHVVKLECTEFNLEYCPYKHGMFVYDKGIIYSIVDKGCNRSDRHLACVKFNIDDWLDGKFDGNIKRDQVYIYPTTEQRPTKDSTSWCDIINYNVNFKHNLIDELFDYHLQMFMTLAQISVLISKPNELENELN